jgi:hypothetical protein
MEEIRDVASDPNAVTEVCPECHAAWEPLGVSVEHDEQVLSLRCRNGHAGQLRLAGGRPELVAEERGAESRIKVCRLWRGPLDGAIIDGPPGGVELITEAGHRYVLACEDERSYVYEYAPKAQSAAPARTAKRWFRRRQD